jgi:hypothetical protein
MKKNLLNLGLSITMMLAFGVVTKAQFDVPAKAGLVSPVNKVEVTAAAEEIALDGYAENGYTSALDLEHFQEGEDIVTGPADLSGSVKMTWNYSYLYFLFKINDNVAHTGIDPSYMFDNVELFLNINIDSVPREGQSNFGDDAIQMRFNRGYDDFYDHDGFGWNAKMDTTATDTMVPGSENIDYYIEDDGSTWTVEAQIPWQVIMPAGSKPEDINDYVDNVMGLDLSVGDSDGDQGSAGARDAVLFWDDDDSGIGNAWYDTRVFGAMTLAGNPITDIKENYSSNVSVYSSNGNLVVKGITANSDIQVINMLGQVVMASENVAVNELEISASQLQPNNLYIVNIKTADGFVVTNKVIVR